MTQMMPGDSDGRTMLRLWQQAIACTGAARADALLAEPSGDLKVSGYQASASGDLKVSGYQVSEALTLGERNLRLLDLHARLFGSELELVSRCPSCGTKAEFSGSCESIEQQTAPDSCTPHQLRTDDYTIEFRLPDARDVAHASECETEDDFVRALAERCVLTCRTGGELVSVRRLPEQVLDALSCEMEALDPAARLSFAVRCPQCSTTWDADLDVGEMVWAKVQASAERLLLDIDTLARAYGWTEADVLALDPVRRAAYLQLASG